MLFARKREPAPVVILTKHTAGEDVQDQNAKRIKEGECKRWIRPGMKLDQVIPPDIRRVFGSNAKELHYNSCNVQLLWLGWD